MLRWEEPPWRPEHKGCASSQRIDGHHAARISVLKSKRNYFQISKGLIFFFLSLSGLLFLWSLAAPVQQQAFGIFPVSHLSPLSLSAYVFESLLSAQYARPAQPNGIRNTASVISQLTWRSPNMEICLFVRKKPKSA